MNSAGDDASGEPLDAEKLAALFMAQRNRLRRMVEFRLDARLAARVDASDVLQEAYLNAQQRLHHVAKKPDVPVVAWLRQVTEQTIVDVQRRHLGAQQRSANREVPLHQPAVGQTTSFALAALLAGNSSTPSQAALREERRTQLEIALEQMDPIDREVLALRHFEELSNAEVAEILGLQPTAASNRYVRALQRLRTIVESMSHFGSE